MKLTTTASIVMALLVLSGCSPSAGEEGTEASSAGQEGPETSPAGQEDIELMAAVTDTSLFLDAELCGPGEDWDNSWLTDQEDEIRQYYPSTGDQTHFFAFVDFVDYTHGESPAQWLKRYGSHLTSFFSENSYGKLNVTLEHNPEWLTMGESFRDYEWLVSQNGYEDHRTAILAATAALDGEVDFSQFDGVHIVYAVEPENLGMGTATWMASRGEELILDGRVFRTVSTNTTGLSAEQPDTVAEVVTHEFGHTLGMADLYAYEGDPDDYASFHRFVGHVDLMGWVEGETNSLLSWNRWRLNWLSNSDVFCLDNGAHDNFQLNSLAASTGPRMLILGHDTPERLVIEYRPLGFDGLAYGGLVAYIARGNGTGFGPLSVLGIEEDPLSWGPENYIDDGQRLCFAVACVELVQSNSQAAIVNISPPSS